MEFNIAFLSKDKLIDSFKIAEKTWVAILLKGVRKIL